MRTFDGRDEKLVAHMQSIGPHLQQLTRVAAGWFLCGCHAAGFNTDRVENANNQQACMNCVLTTFVANIYYMLTSSSISSNTSISSTSISSSNIYYMLTSTAS